MRQISALVLGALVQGAAGYHYLPGMELRDYNKGEPVGPVKVNSLFSHDGIVTYDPYSLKFCSPSKDEIKKRSKQEKLGEIIWGDRIEPSLYRAEMMVDVKCRLVDCEAGQRLVTTTDLQRFEKRINNGYRGAFVLDNLPVVSNGSWVLGGQCPSGEQIYDYHLRGWRLGIPTRCLGNKRTHINNHLVMHIHAHEQPNGKYIIVGFNVLPYSIKHKDDSSCSDSFDILAKHDPVTTDPSDTKEIIWSYSVQWHHSEVQWGHRWDAYLSLAFGNRNARVHWLSIINSLLIVLCLSAIVAMILLRTLHMDFNRYNNPDDADEAQEEVGWKLVHADVFRPPENARWFSIWIGTGVQLIAMCAMVFFFALLGFLSPANRGGLLTVAILLFVLMSIANGFVCSIMLKMFDIREWRTIFWSSLAFPSLLLLPWLVTEAIIWGTTPGANTAPILSMLYVFGLWFGISVPLVFLGAAFGFKCPTVGPMIQPSKQPRRIPPQRWYLQDWFLLLVPGIIPFGAAFIELRFILSSVWQGMVYYVFGFLSLTFVTVAITTAEVTIVLIYFLLVFEDWRWWWRAIVIPGGMGIHFFVYSMYYFQAQLRVRTWQATIIYFETMAIISFAIYIAIGTIGALCGYLFVRVIYGSIKIE
eukprot:Hpha_TRINITY_DN15533_c2_g4::TRINITY_DN15533_c2_g4_i1::g.105207::m.105207/K17086/TM9SF2_4; transmembrane 9 superfamily member 2/4